MHERKYHRIDNDRTTAANKAAATNRGLPALKCFDYAPKLKTGFMLSPLKLKINMYLVIAKLLLNIIMLLS